MLFRPCSPNLLGARFCGYFLELPQGCLDFRRTPLWRRLDFVLPEFHYSPTRLDELLSLIRVTTTVFLYLQPPKTRVAPWSDVVLRTSVPEAPVDEYREFRTRKGDVRSTRDSGGVDSVPEPCRGENLP